MYSCNSSDLGENTYRSLTVLPTPGPKLEREKKAHQPNLNPKGTYRKKYLLFHFAHKAN